MFTPLLIILTLLSSLLLPKPHPTVKPHPTRSVQTPFTALDFTASPSAYVSIPDTVDLQPEKYAKYSYTMRIYFTSLSNNVLPRLIAKGPDYSCIMGNQTNYRKNEFGAEVGSGSPGYLATEYWGNTRLTTGVWYDYTFTFDNGTAQVYINGIPESMTTLMSPFTPPMDSTVGKPLIVGNSYPNYDRGLSGYVSKVRFFQNKVLSPTEVVEEATNDDVTDGLVGKWNMDEGSGQVIHDTSGFNHNGTAHSTQWITL